MAIIGWIIFGLIVGAIARFLMPGTQSMGMIMTILIGVAGSFVGGYLGSLTSGGGRISASLAKETPGTYSITRQS